MATQLNFFPNSVIIYFHNAGIHNEITRSKNNIVVKWRTASAPKTDEELEAVIQIQSGKSFYFILSTHFGCVSQNSHSVLFSSLVIRGVLVRKQLNGTHGPRITIPNSEKYRKKTGRRVSDVKVLFFWIIIMIKIKIKDLFLLHLMAFSGVNLCHSSWTKNLQLHSSFRIF